MAKGADGTDVASIYLLSYSWNTIGIGAKNRPVVVWYDVCKKYSRPLLPLRLLAGLSWLDAFAQLCLNIRKYQQTIFAENCSR